MRIVVIGVTINPFDFPPLGTIQFREQGISLEVFIDAG